MPIVWRRIDWFVSFPIAVLLAAWMRRRDFGWAASLGAAAGSYVVVPFLISQAGAAFVLGRGHRAIRRARHD
jgi:hypothetical protein